MLKRLRVKFVIINMVIVTLMLCVIFGLVIHFTARSIESESLRRMHLLASEPSRLGRFGEDITLDMNMLPKNPENHMAPPADDAAMEEIPGQMRDYRDLIYGDGDSALFPYFMIQISASGEITARGWDKFDLSDEEYLGELIAQVLDSQEASGVLRVYKLRYLMVTLPQSTNIIFADLTTDNATITALVKNCVLIGMLSFILFFGISLLLSRWAVKPVERAWEQQRQFVADASHELKTPLTVILTNAELIQSSPDSEEANRHFSDNILVMARQMRGLVESLLELARLDNGSAKTVHEKVDLSTLISDCSLPFEPLYFEKELELLSDIESDITTVGSPQHLRQVADILLDNAMKYSYAHTSVMLSLRRQGDCAILSAANRGDVIPKGELKNIFRRFYRLDNARSMNHSYGLGLSIAESIVREHRGKIWAESDGGVNTFFVQLPIGS